MSRQDVRYLLHLWREGQEPWRASLRAIATGELQKFPGLDEMLNYLASEDQVPAATGSNVGADSRSERGDDQ